MDKRYYSVMETDVCVVGGSSSGMPAAIHAAEGGAKVVLLEKTAQLGGTLAVCGGFFAVESPTQQRLGIHDSAEECFREVIQQYRWDCDARLVHKWLNGCGDNVRWLESLGMTFNCAEPCYGPKGYTRATYHSSSSGERTGIQMLKCMKSALEKSDIEVFLSTRATELIRDDEGRICAVEAENKNGRLLVRAKSVIVATGSISANKELIARFFNGETYEGTQIMAQVSHNTGDGLLMCEKIGAKVGDISTLYMGPHNHGVGRSELTCMFMRRCQSLKINKVGERFADEGLWWNSNFPWMLSLAIDRQPTKMTYSIFDDRLVKKLIQENRTIGRFEVMTATQDIVKRDIKREHTSTGLVDEKFAFWDCGGDYDGFWLENLMKDIEKEEAAGRVKRCMTIEEIADYIGCKSPETIKQTIERYNMHCRNQYDADFLKDVEYLEPLEVPPYYVFQAPSGIDTIIGGVQVNYDLKVLDNDSYPIPGLYCAGVCSSGWLSGAYAYLGSGLSFSIYSGMEAGKRAAEYAVGKK